MDIIVRYASSLQKDGSKQPVVECSGIELLLLNDDACDRLINSLLEDTCDFEGVVDYRIS